MWCRERRCRVLLLRGRNAGSDTATGWRSQPIPATMSSCSNGCSSCATRKAGAEKGAELLRWTEMADLESRAHQASRSTFSRASHARRIASALPSRGEGSAYFPARVPHARRSVHARIDLYAVSPFWCFFPLPAPSPVRVILRVCSSFRAGFLLEWPRAGSWLSFIAAGCGPCTRDSSTQLFVTAAACAVQYYCNRIAFDTPTSRDAPGDLTTRSEFRGLATLAVREF